MMLTKEHIEKFRSMLMIECDEDTHPYANELCDLALERLAMNDTHMPIAGDRPDQRPTVQAIITSPKVPHDK